MPAAKASQALVAVFPTDDSTLAVRFSRPLTPQDVRNLTVKLKSGMRAGKATVDPKDPRRVTLRTSRMKTTPLTVDVATVTLKGTKIDHARSSVRFAHGVM